MSYLSEIAPGLKRATILFNPDPDPDPVTPLAYRPFLETAGQSFKVEPIITSVRSVAEVEAAITALGRESGGGLVIMPDTSMTVHRAAIIAAAAPGARHGPRNGNA